MFLVIFGCSTLLNTRRYSFLFTSSMLLGSESDFNRIEKYFKNVPADIQTSIYWYWINDNLSKEAVIKDLHSM